MDRDWSQPYQANKQVAAAWLSVYHSVDANWDLYELAEKLVDLDHHFQLWRFSHMKTVERIIGYKRGHRRHRRCVVPHQGAGAAVLPGAVVDPHRDVSRPRPRTLPITRFA